MIILYRIIINFIFILSPIIIIFRLINKKEDVKRFKEKFCIFSKNRGAGKLIWFHGASVGELQSIIPLIEKLEKNKSIRKILITSNTLSSSKIIEKLKLKKIIHQFFPIDTNFHTKKFLDYWEPSSVFFIDSEIWPNMFLNLKKKNIPITLLNGRITLKTFNNWKLFKNFSRKIFSCFELCLSSNLKSKNFLTKLGAKNVKFIGNLKFSQSENEKLKINNKLKKFFSTKKIWCASSTHFSEEKLCGLTHKKLKEKYKNLLTILIPRHVNRVNSILNELDELNLKTHLYSSDKKIDKNTDIFIVDTYGKTKSFYNICKYVFLGGSLINHGGQNPLEAARYGCNILHGPNVSNFDEIYLFLKQMKISQKVYNEKDLINLINNLFQKKIRPIKMQKKLMIIGKKILNRTYKELEIILNKR
tara:strand:+ start:898 stop:2148 length:1251 start_codon:yes stop_codon:yes gene_type:complete